MNFKEHKKALIISSVVILLPIVFGLIIWDQLPDMMTTHWGIDNQPDGWSTKTFAVFFLPLLLLGLHWLCLWITKKDKSQKKQSKKVIAMIFWLMPMVSLFTSAMMYSMALGNTANMTSIVLVLMGLMFVGIGNYMPKIKQNRYLGIKVVWTLNNEENWSATHRFGGRLWVVGGVLIALAGFLPIEYGIAVMFPALLLFTVAPMLYSYFYYKKMCKEGQGYSLQVFDNDQRNSQVAIVCIILILIFVIYFLFTGNINCVYNHDSFTIEASFYDDLTVDYDAIDSIELRNEKIPGTRSFGYGSARLLLGVFENEEFGMYTRYTYTRSQCSIVIYSNDKILVLAAKTAAETEALYHTLLSKMVVEEESPLQ